jgi:predicted DNA-binding transcriptional regulator AlpA
MKQNTEKLLVTTLELQQLLSCGRHTAEWIGREAGARVQLGRSVRWRIQDIEKYLKDKKEVMKS